MYKKIAKPFLLLSILFLFTGCFEIVEDITFNKDGSGHVKLTVNLSKSKTKLNSIMLLDSVSNYKVPSEQEIKNKIAQVAREIQQIEGISNVQYSNNFSEYIFEISCDFKNTDALNEVVMSYSSQKDVLMIKKQKLFDFDSEEKTFTRDYHYKLQKEFNNMNVEDRKVFETAYMTMIYRFQDPIVSSENTAAKISKNKRAIMLRANAQDIIYNKVSVKNKIQLQK